MWKAALKRPSILFGGAVVYIGASTVTYFTLYKPKTTDDFIQHLDNFKRRHIFDENAAKYDKAIDLDEKIMGISLLRRYLLRSCRGDVLEIAAGTGRNLCYYPKSVKQLTFTDFSNGMMEQLKKKKEFEQAVSSVDRCNCHVMCAEELGFPDQSFDTVIDTFGLCSMDDAQRALEEMQRVCRKDGKILLLEHGQSHYKWLSSLLDKFAGVHAKAWGCQWNRDILALVKNAGLEIEDIKRFHFGTTYYIVARPTQRIDK